MPMSGPGTWSGALATGFLGPQTHSNCGGSRAPPPPFFDQKFNHLSISIFHRFLIDFGSILGGFGEGFGGHVGLQDALKIDLKI